MTKERNFILASSSTKNPSCIVYKNTDGSLRFEHQAQDYPTTPISPALALTQPAGDGVYTQDHSPPIGQFRFLHNTITYALFIKQGQVINDIPHQHNIAIAVHAAFSCWKFYGNLEFIQVPYMNPDSADITICFTDSDPIFIQNPSAMAYTYFPNTKPSGAFTSVYNTKYLWSEDGKTNFTNNLNQTLRHELGHGIGLVHTTNPKDIMFPFYHNDIVPTAMDIYQVQFNYGRSQYPQWIIDAFFKLDSKLEEFKVQPSA